MLSHTDTLTLVVAVYKGQSWIWPKTPLKVVLDINMHIFQAAAFVFDFSLTLKRVLLVIVGVTMDRFKKTRIKLKAAEPSTFFILQNLLPCQNLAPQLTTMQLIQRVRSELRLCYVSSLEPLASSKSGIQRSSGKLTSFWHHPL